MTKSRAILTYSLGVSCFGVIGLFRTWSGLDAYGASFVRGVWGALILGLGAVIFNRSIIKVKLSYLIRCLLWGSILGIAIFFYFKTMDYSNQSIAAIFLFLQVVWYPIYTKLFLVEEAQRTRWTIYLSTQLLTIFGTFLALGIFQLRANYKLNNYAIIFGFLVSFTAFLYFVVGRWLFFSKSKQEKEILYSIFNRISLVPIYEKLLNDEHDSQVNLPSFWISYQRTLYQSIGMVFVCFLYIPYNNIFFNRLFQLDALMNGFFLGSICLAAAFFFITYADSISYFESNGTRSLLSTKVKGISQQIELILSLIVGYFLLNETIGMNGLIGCIILLTSYIVGLFFSEKELIATQKA